MSVPTLQMVKDVPLINPQDPTYRSLGKMGQSGRGVGKDILKIGKKVAKQTKIGSTLGRALQPIAVGLASAVNPELGMVAQYATNKGLKEAEKRGYGIGKDVMKAAKSVAKNTQVGTKLAKSLAPSIQALADSSGNPMLSMAVKEGMKQGIKKAEKKGYGKKRKSKRTQ